MNTVFSTLGLIYQTQYGFSSGESGLVYLGMALGSVSGAVLSAWTSDKLFARISQRYGGEIQAEYRIPPTFSGVSFIVIGLFIYGWTLQKECFWLIPIIGLFLLGLGLTTIQVS